jgi:hypothetical protein
MRERTISGGSFAAVLGGRVQKKVVVFIRAARTFSRGRKWWIYGLAGDMSGGLAHINRVEGVGR